MTVAHLSDVEWRRDAYHQTRRGGGPGVDGVTASGYAANLEAHLSDWQARWRHGRDDAPPVKRTDVPKEDGRQRPMGMPTFEDTMVQRAVARLLGASSAPDVHECSYGVRAGRSPHQALHVWRARCLPEHSGWIVDADVRAFFDRLDHDVWCEVLTQRVQEGAILRLIRTWLQAGVLAGDPLSSPERGSPQGDVLSPLLANIALDGLAKRLGKGYRVARYADDIVVMAKSLHAIEQACPVVTSFLDERGLAVHPENTRIVQRTEGFDFLGFHVQMRGQKLLITPQKQQVQTLLQEVRSWLKTHPTVTAEAVIRQLNPLIRGWAMYYRHVVSKHTFQHVDYHIWRALWRWAKRRHPKKPRRWLYRRYFEVGKYGATFYTDSRGRRGQTIRFRLERMPTIPIVRHVKVKGRASPDDPTLTAYWEARRLKRGRQRVAKGSLLYGIAEAQRWQCPGCGQALFDGQEVHLHHRIPVHAGGSDDRANLQWLHATCHRQRHRQGVTAGQSA